MPFYKRKTNLTWAKVFSVGVDQKCVVVFDADAAEKNLRQKSNEKDDDQFETSGASVTKTFYGRNLQIFVKCLPLASLSSPVKYL
jgi:hypothetical protein